MFDGQILNQEKLDKMCGGIGYGFFEGFPLTAASCRKTFREIQTYMVEKTRLGIPGFPVAESLHGGNNYLPSEYRDGEYFQSRTGLRKD